MISTVIIDDDPVARKLMISILKQNFENIAIVGSAENITNGKEMIEKHDPDLVFLDVEMPDGTGFDLLDSLEGRRFKLAMVSSETAYSETAFSYAAQQFLPKPVRVCDVKRFVYEIILKREQRYVFE
ncbi:LytR/AlgR family response regulator transcription factor [Mangrovibacterium diazotrophicum]|uniref:Response regulator receiver domain-containing protein n=1 Tax=Mangrovibacterium diazotrophicum TaxID=1261403 RepID=A0A419W518_9BACT|nr:response regulator [Mangrovibacterium diazotrophicum]RKD90543.1 response regulator receiver domain-containing protein [Mangrovibacterium diazotrophicum]